MLLLISLTVLTLLFSPSDKHADKKLLARQLFNETLAVSDSLPLDEYIEKLQRVIRLNKKFAEAHHELGRAFMAQGTIQSRRRAFEAFQRAIRLQPENTAYRYSLAELELKRGFDSSAKRQYKKIIELDPSDGRPYYHLALFKEKDFLRYREMVSLHENATISFSGFAEQDFEEVERLLRKAIAIDPNLSEAYFRLAALYFEIGRYQKMIELLRNAIKCKTSGAKESLDSSKRSNYFMWLGLAYFKLGQIEDAEQAFEHAFANSAIDQRSSFYSLKSILAHDSLKRYSELDSPARKQQERNYWRSRDPLFLSSANERVLEHFCRIVYSNLRFSQPERGINGSKTDRGKVLIRYGFPLSRTRTRADLGTTPTGRTTLNASKEVWDYGDFYMLFDDRFLNQNYSFAWSMNPDADGKNLFERKIEIEPERFDFPHGGQRLRMPYITAQFRAADSASSQTLVEVYYGLPLSGLRPSGSNDLKRSFNLKRGLFLCDDDWQVLHDWKEDRQLAFVDSNATGGEVLIERWPLHVSPGNYNLSLETIDQTSGHSGAERGQIEIEDFTGSRLMMSSVVLASSIEYAQEDLALYKKGEVSIIPNLSKQFEANTPIHVYYEVYNLSLDSNGSTRFEIENTVEPLRADENVVASAMRSVSTWLGLGNVDVTTTSSFRSSGLSAEEKMFHSIELPGIDAGEYRLTIRVRDLHSNDETYRSVAFQIH